MTQPLLIYYGRFPDRKGNVSGLEDLRGFYTLGENDENGEIYYEADIERDRDVSFIRINSLKTNCFTVLVEGKKNFGDTEYYHFAKASFFLFGHSRIRKKEIKPVPSNEIAKVLQIHINPEYSVWPQTGTPFELMVLFDENPLGGKKIHIVSENQNSMDVVLDKRGNYVYIPPGDRRLRRKGTLAYKQAIILAEQKEKNTIYKSSYTLLLHPPRFGNTNLCLGSCLFAGTTVILFTVTVIRRKKFQL